MKKLILATFIFLFIFVNTAKAATYVTYQGVIYTTVINLTFDYYDGYFAREWRGNYSWGTFEINGIFFTAECSSINNMDTEVCWSYVGIFLGPLIYGIEFTEGPCDSDRKVLRDLFWGFKISD